MATRVMGPKTWSLQRDADGHREYRLTVRVESDVPVGPATALLTPGLPLPGSIWALDGDVDPWAFCHFDCEVKQEVDNEPNLGWLLTFVFSTKPLRRCADQQFVDPLLEPQIVSGGFSNQLVEGVNDRFGRPIVNSSWEQIRGSVNEWQRSYPTVRIKQNVALLQLPLLKAMIDCVNASPIWGLNRREVRLVTITWDQKFYGTCSYYYERQFEFHVKDGTFDRDILDESSKILNGHWDALTGNWILDKINGVDPNPYDPTHFIDFPDRTGNPIRGVLNGRGLPAKVVVGAPNLSKVKYVCIFDGTINVPPADGITWISTTDDPADPADWEPVLTYQRGRIVTEGGRFFIANKKVFNEDPTTTTGTEWTEVPAFVNKSTYNPATTYFNGQYVVTDSNTAVQPEGYAHVEYYNEAEFLLLGIPLSVGL